MFKRKPKQNGVTLIEVLLIVSLAALVIMAGLAFWRSISDRYKAEEMGNTMLILGDGLQKSLTFYNHDSFTNGTLNDATLREIARASINPSYYNGDLFFTAFKTPMTIQYGGLLIPNATINRTHGVNITLNDLTPKQCILTLTQGIEEIFSQFRINGQPAIDTNGLMNNHVSTIARSCNERVANQIVFSMPLNRLFSVESDPITQDEAYIRNKDPVSYLGKAASNDLYTGATNCSGGSNWSDVASACTCPANTKWMGSACVPFNNNGTNISFIGTCNLGFGYSYATKRCEPLPRRNAAQDGVYVADEGKTIARDLNNTTLNVVNTSVNALNTSKESIPENVEIIAGRDFVTTPQQQDEAATSLCIRGTKVAGKCDTPQATPTNAW